MTDSHTQVAQLNNYANVQTLGYVHTSYGTRPLSNVTADIAVYAGWSAYNGSDIHVDGIFFDESPIDTQYVNYMTQANSFAKQKITGGSPKAYTVFNTGVNAPSPFYALADSSTPSLNPTSSEWSTTRLLTPIVLAYENSYSVSNSTGQNAALNAIPAAVRNTSLVVINHYTNTTAQLALDTAGLMQENIAGLFITTKPSYGTFSAGWTQFVGDVARGVGKGS